jgi:hypothetical protein
MDIDDRDSELSGRLFHEPSEKAGAGGLTYDGALLEQYKLYVEMADRISARRALANSFFLTLNTSVITAFAAFTKVPTGIPALWLTIPLVALVGECFAWFYLVRSYRLLNGAKYRVVGALEERLPASPFWRAEWWALGEGHDRARYWPLSHIEQWIPILFALTYIGGVVGAVLRPPSH